MLNHSQLQSRWAELRYWQKGAILGTGIHVLGVVFFMTLTFIGYWFSPKYGEVFSLTKRHIAEFFGSFALIFFGLIEAIPIYILRLFGSGFGPPIDADAGTHIGEWVFYILYATAVYCFLGAGIGKVVELLKSKDNMRGTGEKGN
ncbi:MAG: hypothetical protein HY204_05760 [Nitrospirae bacterium]|nr:hypothetical protein [Nitrospirota bacterium]